MKCFYHRVDLDGHCSGAIVKLKCPECEMIGVDYNDEFDFSSLTINEEVFIVDFSFPPDIMKVLYSKYRVHWIDHHKSAIEKCKDLSNFPGIREIGKAGCELTWKYLFPDKPIPEAVRLLGRYDVWDHQDPDVLPFQYGMRSLENTHPDLTYWKDLLLPSDNKFFELILGEGITIFHYQQTQDEKYAKGMSFETEFEGLRAIAVNKALCNSKVFDSVYDPEKHDIMIVFGMKAGQFKYSLYCAKDEIDVSEIAKKHGGGGHKGAAGFHANEYML
jgi:uncharacterized protein